MRRTENSRKERETKHTKNTRWFIRRPHAIERFRERAEFKRGSVRGDNAALEGVLRTALEKVWLTCNKAEGNDRFFAGRETGEYAVMLDDRVCPELVSGETLYAIVRHVEDEEKGYLFLVPTVITANMRSAWDTEEAAA